MSIFKRLSATLSSRLDQVVGEIENHDAVIQATLNEMRKKVAAAKVRLGQVRREEENLRKQMQEQQANAQRWRERAVGCAGQDENKALECVQRSRRCQEQVTRMEEGITRYAQTAEKLARDIEVSEQGLAEMKQKLTMMRARESTSSALQAANDMDTRTADLLADTFDRWEINISQAEMAADHVDPIDPIEQEFVTREQREILRGELDELLAASKQEEEK